MPDIETIPSAVFCARLKAGEAMDILDVRTAVEHKGAHLTCGHDHTPLDGVDADAWLRAHPDAARRPLYIICASGKRAARAAGLFAGRGVRAVVVEGGLGACAAEGAPINKKNVLSLERQVRIGAGFLLLLGTVLGAAANPAFYALSGLVGAGLVFAGITDRCGMALLLARAPWNRDRQDQAVRQSLHAFEQKHQGASS